MSSQCYSTKRVNQFKCARLHCVDCLLVHGQAAQYVVNRTSMYINCDQIVCLNFAHLDCCFDKPMVGRLLVKSVAYILIYMYICYSQLWEPVITGIA